MLSLSKFFFEHVMFANFSSTLLFYVCTLSLSTLSTSSSMYISFSLLWFFSIKIKFSFWFDFPVFYPNIIYLEGKFQNKYFFAKIRLRELYENQLKHLQANERKIKNKCNVLKKFTLQLCKWNTMCKSEM